MPSPVDDRLLSLSAKELSRRIAEGELTARDACEVHIARIEEVNPTLNAVVAQRFEQARREADAADALRSQVPASSLPPLHGVPCTVKESFQVKGMPNTSGLLARKDVVAAEDAVTVARLKDAGAIVLGVTNTSELCLWMESDNRVWGRTSNPYDPTRIVGGSSGGEGAIVGAGGSPFGLGSDIGGSLRLPAFFNGVFTHKPSPGLVPNTGQYPTPATAVRLLGTGVLARRAEDLPLLTRILSGPDGVDGLCDSPPAWREPQAVDVSSLRVLVVEGDGRLPIAPSLLKAQREAAQALRALGCRVETVALPRFQAAFEYWAAAMAEASDTPFAELLGQGTRVKALPALAQYLAGRSPYTFPSVTLVALEGALDRLGARREKALEEAKALEAEVLALLADDAVLLYPPYTTPAPPHGWPVLRPFHFTCTAIFNVLGLPVTQVPTGLSDEGLPLGVQVASAPGGDARTLAVAQALERALGGWRLPAALAKSPTLTPLGRLAGAVGLT